MQRHQTLRAAIDWSYELLTEARTAAPARLAVFAGGCTRDGSRGGGRATPIERRGRCSELLAGLVARSLVVAERDGPETRYRLLETIREYGEERLAEHGETEAVRAATPSTSANWPVASLRTSTAPVRPIAGAAPGR